MPRHVFAKQFQTLPQRPSLSTLQGGFPVQKQDFWNSLADGRLLAELPSPSQRRPTATYVPQALGISFESSKSRS